MPTFKPLPIAIAVAAVLVVAAVGYGAWTPESPTLPATGAGTATAAHPDAAQHGRGAAGGAPGPNSALLTINDATMGTLDAARLFELGFAGGLVIDQSTRSAIEAVLNSMPEKPSEDDLKRLERTLREGLPREDAEKALKLFSSYRGYTSDVHTQLEPLGIPRNLQEMNAFFDQMESVKRRHFDEATASALFGQHDVYARASMEAMFVEQDTTLTPAQKKERLDALRAKLPPDQQSLIPQPNSGEASQPAS